MAPRSREPEPDLFGRKPEPGAGEKRSQISNTGTIISLKSKQIKEVNKDGVTSITKAIDV